MLKLNRTFAGAEQQPGQPDIQNFQAIGHRIYSLTYYIITVLHK